MLAVWVMLPMPPVPATVTVDPVLLMVTREVPLKDKVPVVAPSPIDQLWVLKVMAEVLVRVMIAAAVIRGTSGINRGG